MEEHSDKLDFIKINTFDLQKQTTESIFTTHTSDRRLVPTHESGNSQHSMIRASATQRKTDACKKHFTKEGIRMGSKWMRIWSASVVLKERQVKSTVRHTPTGESLSTPSPGDDL